jgi:hypothetical protein
VEDVGPVLPPVIIIFCERRNKVTLREEDASGSPVFVIIAHVQNQFQQKNEIVQGAEPI